MPHDVRRGQNRVEDSSPSLILLKKECSCKAAGQQHLDQHLHLLQAGFAAEKGVLKECVLFGIWTAWWSWWCITKRRCRNAKVIIIIISRRSHSLFNDLGVFFSSTFSFPFSQRFFPFMMIIRAHLLQWRKYVYTLPTIRPFITTINILIDQLSHLLRLERRQTTHITRKKNITSKIECEAETAFAAPSPTVDRGRDTHLQTRQQVFIKSFFPIQDC